MNKNNYSEKDLCLNLSEVALEIVREFYVATKKVSVYSFSHPLAAKAVGRLYYQMERVFRLKEFVNFHLANGHLYVLNIELKPSVFADQVIEYMQLLDVRSILFGSKMTVEHLSLFLDKFVRRIPTGVYQNMMQEYLTQKKIDTIGINSEEGDLLFEKGIKYRADILGDFSVRNILGQCLGNMLEDFAEMLTYKSDDVDKLISKFGIDYYPSLVAYLIPEKISLIDPENLQQLVSQKFSEITKYDPESKGPEFGEIKKLLNTLSLHPERARIFSSIESNLTEGNLSSETYSDLIPQTSAIRVESSERINQFLYATFNQELPGHDLTEFEDLFGRIIRTGQQNRAESVISVLLSHLAGPHFELRERALKLFRYILGSYQPQTSAYLLDHIIKRVKDYLEDEQETFEFSDLIWALAQTCLLQKDYCRLSALCEVLSQKCTLTDGIRCYESVAVKKGIEELDRSEVINQLVNELMEGDAKNHRFVRTILVTINSEDAAFRLSSIISHDSRQVRMSVLKILSEMGKPALNVCSHILEDNSNFELESGRRELPDDKWYIVRNAIFVLGSLEDPEGCVALRHRISFEDTRVRLAIVSALEKISDETAADMLIMMANDNDQEIREAAIIALGVTGQADIVPELLDLAERRKTEVISIISALGNLGGHQSTEFLTTLLNDNKMISRFTSNRSSRDDIKVAIIKALGRIGDDDSIKTVKNFTNNLTSTQKIFFGGAKINKVAEDILKRKK